MPFTYPCIVFSQRDHVDAPHFCLFAAPVSDVLEWAAIERLGPDNKAPQRRRSPSKVKAVERFLALEERNTIPTSVLVSLDGAGFDLGETEGHTGPDTIKIHLDGDAQPGLVIDGQHRLLGINEFNPEMLVSIVALLDVDDAEKAFQFLVVNNKASRVPQNHIRALALSYDKDLLGERLKTARQSLSPNLDFVQFVNDEPQSPFQGLIDWPLTPDANRVVPPAAIESSFAFIQNQKVREIRAMGEDVLLEFFYALWQPVKEAWPKQWEGKTRLLSKVGVFVMTQYMTTRFIGQMDALAALDSGVDLDPANPEDVRKSVRAELNLLDERFWEVEWRSKGLDTQAGRSLLLDSLRQISRNVKTGLPWYADVDLIDPSEVESGSGE